MNNKTFDETGELDCVHPFSGEHGTEFVNSDLAEVFDRYSSALDLGDDEGAEAILAEYPEIGNEFRAPLRGLYLLGRAASQQELDLQPAESGGRRRLGDFEIKYELGRGGMGIVYAATQCSLQRQVALKVLPFTAVLDPRQVARFRNEAQAAASLHHPNIVPVYAVGCERGVHYYSMQLIEGQSLEQFVKQLGKRSVDNKTKPATIVETAGNISTVVSIQSRNYVRNVIEIGARIAEALEFAHEQGIVHRDIKPSNLLLDQTGKIWVADFGLARCRGNSNLTSQGDRLGTARYMSPEQAAGRTNQVDFRSDIYSLGVTLYELLTLQPAFEAPDRMQLQALIESKDPRPLRSINASIPFDLETVIGKAIAKTPADRYASAGEFAGDLLRCLAGKPIMAKRQSVFDRVCKSMAKHKWLVAGACLVMFVVAITATTVASVFYQQRQREHASAESARFYLQQAHNAVNRFGVMLSDELNGIPGTESLQAKLLGEAIGYYDDFLVFAEQSPDLQFERAKTFAQMGRLHERAGNDPAALESYTTSIARLGELTEQPEFAANAEFELAICLDRLGLLHKRLGSYGLSAETLESALARFRSLDSSISSRPDVVAAFAQTRANLALLKWTEGSSTDAGVQFEQALAILEETGERCLQDVELRSAWFKINGNFVSVLAETDLDRAEQVLRESITELGLVQTSDKDLAAENAAHVADMQNNLAVVLCHKNDLAQASIVAQDSIEYWQSQMVQSPLDLTVAQGSATAHNTLGEVLWRKNDFDLADKAFSEAENQLRRVVSQMGHLPEPLSRLAGVLHNRSLVKHCNQDAPGALDLVKLAIDYQSRAALLVPSNSRYQKLLATHQQAQEVFLSNISPGAATPEQNEPIQTLPNSSGNASNSN